MEQRRTIGYILLALAAVICLASNVWYIVKMPMGGEKVSHLLLRTLPEVLALLTVVYIFVRQGKSVNLKLDIRERRLKLDESNAIDPYGYSYIMMGAMSVFVTLIFAVDIMDKLGVPLFDKISAGWCIVVLSVLTVALVLWLSVKIEMAKRHDNNSLPTMKERNKSIFRILLFASVGILLAQTVLMVVLGDDAEVRIVLPVIIFFSELITGVMIAYFTLNPQYNRNYTIHRRDGRWRWEHVTYGPDPDGMRYISAGVGALMIALLFAVISFAVLCPHVVNETVLVIAVVVLLSAFCVIYCIIENKLRKQL